MSSFTEPLIVTAVPGLKSGWKSYLPPGFHPPKWKVEKGFHYYVGQVDPNSEIIEVPEGYTFDGASAPWLFRAFVPMAHPNYIQAAALHDWMLDSKQYPRHHCDAIFHEALTVLGMNPLWSGILYCAVRFQSTRRALEALLRK